MNITDLIITGAEDWKIRMQYKLTIEGLKWVKKEVTELIEDTRISPKILAKKLKALDSAFNRYLIEC
jgi:predicted transcriptional regulator